MESRGNHMFSKRLVIAVSAVLIVLLFLMPLALACNYPGPAGSSITVFAHTSDGTPLPGTQLTLTVSNGSHVKATESGTTGDDGKFTFPNDGSGKTGLSYKIEATYYGDTVTVECDEPAHSASYGPFSLSANENKIVDITIPGVTVEHSGDAPANPGHNNNNNNNNNNNKPGEHVDNPYVYNKPYVGYPPMAPGQSTGIVMGVILSNNSYEPIDHAYVAIVSAADPSIVYAGMYTNANGFYQFYNVNSTIGDDYMLLVAKGCDKDKIAYTSPFGVESANIINGDATKLNLVFVPNGSDGGTLVVTDGSTPSVQPTVSPTVTAVPPSGDSGDNNVDTTSAPQTVGFVEQVKGFIAVVIYSIFPKF